MSGYEGRMISRAAAHDQLRAIWLRGDMAADFAAEGGVVPTGPVWRLTLAGRLLGMGGLEPQGAAASSGWLLVGDGLSVRDWAVARRMMREALTWAAWHGVKRVRALVDAGSPGAQRLLVGLGFEASAREGDDITMTKELT